MNVASYIYLACRQHAMHITFSAQACSSKPLVHNAAQNPTIERL